MSDALRLIVFCSAFPEEAPAANSFVQEAVDEEPPQVEGYTCVWTETLHRPHQLNCSEHKTPLVFFLFVFFKSQMEENNLYEVPADEASDRGTCARALYDYQAGEWGICHYSSVIAVKPT